MKYIWPLLLISCSQKYQTYYVVDKYQFKVDQKESPITPKLLPTRKISKRICADQYFFSNNALTDSKRRIESALASLCPDSQFLLNNKVTEDWWTTIIYSRACMTFEGYCSKKSDV